MIWFHTYSKDSTRKLLNWYFQQTVRYKIIVQNQEPSCIPTTNMLKTCPSQFLLSTCHNLKLPEKKKSQVENCPSQIALSQVCKEMSHMVILVWDPRPLWVAPALGGWAGFKKTSREKAREGASKSTAFLCGPVSVPAWVPSLASSSDRLWSGRVRWNKTFPLPRCC